MSAALIAAQVCGADGDLARMRELVATAWEQAHPQFSDHAVVGIMWVAVRDFTRIEVDAAVHRPEPQDRAAAEAHLATIADYASRNSSLRRARQSLAGRTGSAARPVPR